MVVSDLAADLVAFGEPSLYIGKSICKKISLRREVLHFVTTGIRESVISPWVEQLLHLCQLRCS